MSLLTVSDVSKRFGGVVALDGVEMKIEEGEILGLTTAAGIWLTAAVGVACGRGNTSKSNPGGNSC